jgi:UDP-glucose 4-epimerase
MAETTVVTGASGFIGRAVVGLLPGADVIRLQRVARPAEDGRSTAIDLRAPDAATLVAEAVPPGPVRLIHLAGECHSRDIDALFEANVAATLHLVDSLAGRLVHVTFASSVAVYGTACQRTDANGRWTVAPDTAYGRSKWLAEQALSLFFQAEGVPVAVLRVASVYGPGNVSGNAVQAVTTAAVEGKPFRIFAAGAPAARDYIYVEDAARAVVAASSRGYGGTLDIGSGRATGPAELAGIVRSLGVDLTVVDETGTGVTTVFECDVSAAADALGLAEPVAVADGLRAEITWRRGEPSRSVKSGPS